MELGERIIERIEPTEESPFAYVSVGWVDLISWSWQPQTAPAESLLALAERAHRGGFTQAVVGGWHGWHDPALLIQLRKEAKESPVFIHFLATWADEEGKIAPLESLKLEGAIGWTLPPLQPIPWRTLRQALPYLRYLGGLLFILPFWEGSSGEIGVPEAMEVALAGWQGIPEYAESAALFLITALHRHLGGNLLVGPLTTRAGYELARQYGVSVFTAPPYLAASASKLLSYDPIWKLHPPLRCEADRFFLAQAAAQLNLYIASWDMSPPLEEKKLEWSSATIGQPTLEKVAHLLWCILSAASEEEERLTHLISLLAEKPRLLLGLAPFTIEEGTPLDLTVLRLREVSPLPFPWQEWHSPLEVLGTIRCLADAHNLQSQMS